MLAALRVRDFRLLWGAGLVSSMGSWLLALAVPAHVFLVTRSLAAAGLTQAAEYLPLLVLGPVAGVAADRWDRRRVMITADVFRAGAVALMLLGVPAGRSWVLYGALAAESSGSVVFIPALRARTPEVVGTGSALSSANALTTVSSGVVRLVGGPLGGALLGLTGFRALVCADAASYLLSALALAATSRQPGLRSAGRTASGAVRRDLAEGLRVVRDHPAARALFAVTTVFLAGNAMLGAVFVPFGVVRLGGAAQAGLLLSALGAGFLLGAPASRVLAGRLPVRHALAATLTAAAVAFFLLFRSRSLAGALPAATAAGMAGSVSLVIAQTALQRTVPSGVLGRVAAAFLAGEAAVTLLGALTGPALAQAIRFPGVAAAGGAATLAAAVLAYLLVPPGARCPALARPASPAPGGRRTVSTSRHRTAWDGDPHDHP